METTATKRIESVYQVRDEDVWAFLDAHSFLVPLLLEAPAHIKNYFPESELFLEMFVDPETVGVRSLLIVIAARLEVDAALKKLNELDHYWWLAYSDEAQGKLELYLEMMS
jgi:hypothetical protein